LRSVPLRSTVRQLHRWLLIPGDGEGLETPDHRHDRSRSDRHAGVGPRAALASSRGQREDVA